MLLIYCFTFLTLFVGGFVLVFGLLCIILCPFLFCNPLDEEERVDCFAFIVFL